MWLYRAALLLCAVAYKQVSQLHATIQQTNSPQNRGENPRSRKKKVKSRGRKKNPRQGVNTSTPDVRYPVGSRPVVPSLLVPPSRIPAPSVPLKFQTAPRSRLPYSAVSACLPLVDLNFPRFRGVPRGVLKLLFPFPFQGIEEG